MPSNADYTREYFQIIDELDGDIESRRAAFNYMQDSTAIVHHQVVASSFVPRLFNRKTYEVMKRTAETSHRILCKVIERYRADEEYRKLFDFDERLVELILLPRDYDSVLPFARVDTFLNEDDYRIHFCEFNGDGSAGMNENREITNSIVGSDTFRTFAENHAVQGCDLFMPLGARLHGHLRHLSLQSGEPPGGHLRLLGERRGGRVPHLRREVPRGRRGMRRGRRARANL